MNNSLSILQLQNSQLEEQRFLGQKERTKHESKYPPFAKPGIVHESLSSVNLPRIRVNTLLVRPYTPSGFTLSGLYVEKGTKYPKIWGHVLALHQDLSKYTDPYSFVPGDLVLYHRFSTEELFTVPAKEPLFPGEKLEVRLIHVDAIQCLFTDRLVEMRV